MNDNQHLLRLIGRKMAGEASPEERAELRLLAEDHPQLQSFMTILEELWKSTETRDERQLEQAWQRHSDRLEKTTRYCPGLYLVEHFLDKDNTR